MNITKMVGLKHSFQFGDDTIDLTINTNFTSLAYKEFMAGLRQAVDDEDVHTLSEMACFLIKGWNLEDDAGDIPLVPKEVYSRVPFMLLTQIVNEAQAAIATGGLSKKN